MVQLICRQYLYLFLYNDTPNYFSFIKNYNTHNILKEKEKEKKTSECNQRDSVSQSIQLLPGTSI